MPVGDDAAAAGYPLVPDNTEEGRVRWGAREITVLEISLLCSRP